MTPRVAILVLLLGLAATLARAQRHPNVALGFNPDGLYQLSELDSVALFNRSVVIRIPIGPRYPVGGQLGYQLVAVHNTAAFDSISAEGPGGICGGCRNAFPNVGSNLGLAWRISLGRLVSPFDPNVDSSTFESEAYVYEDASAAEHAFRIPYEGQYAHYDPSYPPVSHPVLTADDSSGLRMVEVSGTERVIQYGNGERHTFKRQDPTNHPYRWRLTRIDDRDDQSGNWIKVDYTPETGGPATQWTITDSAGRSHTIDLEAAPSMENTAFDGHVIDKVTLTAPDNGTAIYDFQYQDLSVDMPCSQYPAAPAKTRRLLKKIVLPTPEATAFEFAHHLSGCWTAGAIEKMTLPTGATVKYVYETSGLPLGDLCGGSNALPSVPALVSRTIKTLDGEHTWSYVQSLGKEYSIPHGDLEIACQKCTGRPDCKNYKDVWEYQKPRRWARTTVLEPAVGDSRVRRDHYFSLWRGGDQGTGPPILLDQTFGAEQIRYGLPSTVAAPAHGPNCDQVTEQCDDAAASEGEGDARVFLSTRTFGNCTGVSDCAATSLLRSAYLRFKWYTFGYEADRNRTVFDDDTGCKTAANEPEKCWTEVQSARENGAGKFRDTSLVSNFRREQVGSPVTESIETTEYKAWTSIAQRLSSGNKWLLDVFTEKARTEGSVIARTEFSFDTLGRVIGTRLLAGANRGAKDVLNLFAYDSKSNLIGERSYGGDLGNLGTTNCCDAPSAENPRYLARSEYQGGMLRKSELIDRDSCTDTSQPACLPVLTTADYTLDVRSGVVTAAKDPAEVSTTYTYDSAFRVKEVAPTGAAKSTYEYIAATASTNALVVETVKDGASTISTTTYEFDGLGRPKRISKSLPNGKVAVTETKYDALRRKAEVSQPVQADSHPTTSVGAFWTTTSYDALGRPTSIKGPDTKTQTFSYTGARETVRSTPIVMSSSGVESYATTTEQYDAQGRLMTVKEKSGDTGDGITEAQYTYDVGGRIASVEMKHGTQQTQTRTFNYDLRGFLTSETHPESGTTTYADYDPRGHFTKKTEGGTVTLHEFDSAERLTKITSGGTLLKQFQFAGANDGNNLKKGKLETSIRRNASTIGGTNEVLRTDTYEYDTPGGQMSKRKTIVTRNGATMQEFETKVDAYDPLRLPKVLTMPTCSASYGCTTTSGIPQLSMSRTAGYLTSVAKKVDQTETSYGSLTHDASGMLKTLTHHSAPASTDNYDVANGIARPSKITFGGIACPSITASTITATPATTICGGVAGTASVPDRAAEQITHTWQITGGTLTSPAQGNSITFTAGASGSVTLTVTARSSCAATAISTKTIDITPLATATLTTGPSTVNRGTSVSLSVTLTGPTPRTIVWSDGVTENVNTDSWTRTVTPQITTTYSLSSVTAGDCTGTASGATTITVIPPAPHPVVATTQTNRTVQVSWASVSGASQYEVERRLQRDAIGTSIGTTSATSLMDTVPESTGSVTYVYYVRTIDTAGTLSGYGGYDHATCATVLHQQPVLTPGATHIRAADLYELRQSVDALRYAFYLTAGTYSPASVIRARDFLEIIAALNQVRAVAGQPPFAYTGGVPTPAAGGTVRAAHVEQLREALR